MPNANAKAGRTKRPAAFVSGAAPFTVPVEGGELYGEEMGAGPALLLLHGWTLDRRMWRPQFEALSQDFRVIAIDRRGFGQSTPPPDLKAEIGDVIAVLDARGLDVCALAGMSQAGRIALKVAHRHPQRIRALILQGSAPADADDGEAPIAAFRGLAREGRLAELRESWRAHPLTRTFSAAAEASLSAMLADYGARDLLAPESRPPLLDERCLRAIEAPSLIIAGEHDTPSRRSTANALARTLPNAQCVTIPDAGHLCNLCNPERYNAALRAFLSR